MNLVSGNLNVWIVKDGFHNGNSKVALKRLMPMVIVLSVFLVGLKTATIVGLMVSPHIKMKF